MSAIEMARAIAANMDGVSALQRCAFLDGEWDNAPSVQAALAAINETTEAAAKLSNGHFWKSDFAKALRDGEHLKAPQS